MRREAIAGGVALLTAATTAGCGGGGAGAGPLAWPKDAGSSVVSIPVNPGQFAVTAIQLDSLAVIKHPLVLLDVSPQHAKDGHGLTIRYAASTARVALELGARRV